MEFLERVTEWLNRTRENRWSIVKNFIDEGFKGINDNWWSAIRNEVHSYYGFQQMFREKYWSEPVSYTHLDVYKRQDFKSTTVY